MSSANKTSENTNSNFDSELEQKLYESLIFGTKASNSFPSDFDEMAYYETLPEFQERINDFRKRIVNLIVDMAHNVDSGDDAFDLDKLRSADPSDVDGFGPLAGVSELLLENIDSFLENVQKPQKYIYSSHKGGVSSEYEPVEITKRDLVRDVRAGLHNIVTHADISRPQDDFTPGSVDNTRSPFKPRLVEKLHARVSLEKSYTLAEQTRNEDEELLEKNTMVSVSDIYKMDRFPNPYTEEINFALENPPAWVLEKSATTTPRPVGETPLLWVDTVSKLEETLKALNDQRVIAVDLENHSYRSFQGFVCLMQLSTVNQDFVIDTLVLRDHMHLLNAVFANPNIVKLLHGSDSDILWLQRDFGIYVVQLFDTGQAARTLSYPSASLAHSLSRHCNVKVNKAYQLADWRVRPLTEEMLKYAREDTHYLIFIFENMRNELLESKGTNGIREVFRKSSKIALQSYEKEQYTPESYTRLLSRRNVTLDAKNEELFASVYGWRDLVARREDESTQYVLPDRMLLRIAIEIPTDAAALERCCNPLPPIVQTRVTELLALIRSVNDARLVSEHHQVESPCSRNSKVDLGETMQMGLNSGRVSFVPIANLNPTTATHPQVTSLQSHAIRATPSPVLTTEQLYDTAGWRDVLNPEWKAGISQEAAKDVVKARVETRPKDTHTHSDVAARLRSDIGVEQLNAGGYSNAELDTENNMEVDSDNESCDSPANADALESEDIPRSMAEIYRISNRNRKRNKDKKKQRDDNGSVPSGSRKNTMTDDELEEADGGDDGSVKPARDSITDEDKVTNAIEFMRDIGWVEGSQPPVASLMIEGAPEELKTMVNSNTNNDATESRGGGSKNHGTTRRGAGRKATPSSPRRGRGSASVNSAGSRTQKSAANARGGGAFHYSQSVTHHVMRNGTNSSAGQKQQGDSSSTAGGSTQGNKVYRGKSGAASRSMTYRN